MQKIVTIVAVFVPLLLLPNNKLWHLKWKVIERVRLILETIYLLYFEWNENHHVNSIKPLLYDSTVGSNVKRYLFRSFYPRSWMDQIKASKWSQVHRYKYLSTALSWSMMERKRNRAMGTWSLLNIMIMVFRLSRREVDIKIISLPRTPKEITSPHFNTYTGELKKSILLSIAFDHSSNCKLKLSLSLFIHYSTTHGFDLNINFTSPAIDQDAENIIIEPLLDVCLHICISGGATLVIWSYCRTSKKPFTVLTLTVS